ncbi:hypothetical protein FNF28_05967 [Cafeteria roenbergensis]|uniref:START domain-containing protein n=1 Tax=Cafeteria roenbergensis TaxID=33653 RepID=A0A5A8D1C3_CAFRO|nr:hypothetical protein FNF28_05967 [Cafeteria roenbergensis]
MPDPCAVVLLNGSLRLDDNPLLEHVAGAACVPFATQEWAGCPATAPWERGVFDALDERLEALCSGLAVMKGGDVSHAAFRELVAAAGATTLLVGEERSGLDELRKLAAAAGIEAKLVSAGGLLWREERERFAARVASKSAELSFADRGRLCAKALALGGWKAALHHVAEGAATPADLSAGTPAALCGAAPGTVDLLASGLSSCLLLGAAAVRQALTWDEYCRRRVDRRPADAAVPERWMALHSLPWAGADGCLDGHGVPAWAPKSPLTASAGEWAAAAAVSGPAAIGDAMAVVSRAFAAADATAADQRAEATSAAVASMPARAAWLASGRTGYPAVDAAVRCAASCGLLSADLQTLVIVHACQYMHLPWQAAVRWLAGLLVGGAALLPALAVRAQWSLGLLLEPEAPASHPHQMADPAAGRFARHRDPSGRFAAAWCPELDAAGIPEHWRYAPFSSGARCQPAGGAPGTPDAAGGSDAAVAPKLVPHPAHWDPTLASAAPTDSARAASEAPTDAEALLAVGATTLLRPCVSRPPGRPADSFAAMQADGPWLEASSGWRLREVHPDAAAWGVSVDSTDGAPLPLLVEEDAALVFEMSDADALGHGWTQTIHDPSSELRAWMRPSEENPAIRKGAAIFTSHGLPASAVAAVIADLELYTLWDRSWADVRPVRRINDDNEALYFVTQTPPVPFVQARDFPMVRHVMSDNERGEHVIMFRSAEHELCPPRKNHTRGLTLGVIGFTVQDVPTAAGEPPACRVSFVTAADARGNIPAWIINFIGKSLPVSWRDTCSTAAREAFLA